MKNRLFDRDILKIPSLEFTLGYFQDRDGFYVRSGETDNLDNTIILFRSLSWFQVNSFYINRLYELKKSQYFNLIYEGSRKENMNEIKYAVFRTNSITFQSNFILN